MSEWQPIETAPKDPLNNLLLALRCDNGSYSVMEAWWDHETEAWWAANLNSADDAEPLISYVGDPTHWMPLPDPPASR